MSQGWCCTADPLFGNPGCATEFAYRGVSQWRGCCGSCTEEVIVNGTVHRNVKQSPCLDLNSQVVLALRTLNIPIPTPEEPRACAYLVHGSTRRYLPPFNDVHGHGCAAMETIFAQVLSLPFSAFCSCTCPPELHVAVASSNMSSTCTDNLRTISTVEENSEDHIDCGGPCPPCELGCTAPLATNFNAAANVDDGSCIFDQVQMCSDPLSVNYSSNASGTYAQACEYRCESLLPHLIPRLNAQLNDVTCATTQPWTNGDDTAFCRLFDSAVEMQGAPALNNSQHVLQFSRRGDEEPVRCWSPNLLMKTLVIHHSQLGLYGEPAIPQFPLRLSFHRGSNGSLWLLAWRGIHTQMSAPHETGDGGAITVFAESRVEIHSCLFYRLEAERTGGAIFVEGADLQVDGSTFVANKARQGGAINSLSALGRDNRMLTSTIRIRDSLFRDNEVAKADGAQVCGGGALSATLSELHVSNSNFTANVANITEIIDHNSGGIQVGGGGVLYVANMAALSFLSVHIDDFSFSKSVVTVNSFPAFCRDMPCSPGYRCLYDNFSLWCTKCPYPLVSTDGLTCARCQSAHGPSQEQDECTACQPGKASTSGECRPCLAGAQPNPGQTDCTACESTFVSTDGTNCTVCPANKQPNANKDRCRACRPLAELFDETTRLCTCSAGWSRKNGECELCAPGRFKSSAGEQSCGLCPLSSITNLNRTQCACPAQTYNISYGKISCFNEAEEISPDELTAQKSISAASQICQLCDQLPCIDCGSPSESDPSSHVTVRPGYGLPETLLRSGYTGLQSGGQNIPKNIFGCPARAKQCQGEQRGGIWAQMQCMQGYMGVLCNICADEQHGGVAYGKHGHECVACSELGVLAIFNPQTVLLICVVVACIIAFHLKRQQERKSADELTEKLWGDTMKDIVPQQAEVQDGEDVPENAPRAAKVVLTALLPAFSQPLRILISFAQVCTQLGGVLMVTLPERIRKVLQFLYENLLVDIWSLFLHFDCLGLRNYYIRWVMHVFILPTFLFSVAYAFKRYQIYVARSEVSTDLDLPLSVEDLRGNSERSRNNRGERAVVLAQNNFKGAVFWIVFICYPSICRHAFEIFQCRRFSDDEDLLEADYTLPCTTSLHFGFQLIGGVVIAVVAIGVPVTFAILLYSRSYYIDEVEKDKDKATAEAVLNELKLTKDFRKREPDPAQPDSQAREAYDKDVQKSIEGLNVEDVLRLLRDLRLSSDFGNLIKIYKPGAKTFFAS
eukprot:SAG31_NODE_921_length_10984_cov_2.779329_9_plen_1244_part_00